MLSPDEMPRGCIIISLSILMFYERPLFYYLYVTIISSIQHKHLLTYNKHIVTQIFCLSFSSDIDVFIISNHSQPQKTSDYHRMRVTELGIPFGVVVDAAFHDDRRKKSYLFTSRWVWRYDDERGELDNGYPRRSHHEFRGLMRHRPSAAVTLNGKGFLLTL